MGMKTGEAQALNRTTHIVTTSIGVICGLIGIQHGVLEILQGNVPITSLVIDAIGPAQKMWESSREPALSILPNMLVTGIVTVFFSILVIIWSIGFVHRKRGALIFFILSLAEFLTGGGITSFELSILAALAASRINRPLTWWRRVLPAGLRRVLARSWLILLIAFIALFAATITITIVGLGFLDGESTITLLYVMGLSTLGLMAITVVAGFAADIELHVEDEGQQVA
jgi:hypothetical protein